MQCMRQSEGRCRAIHLFAIKHFSITTVHRQYNIMQYKLNRSKIIRLAFQIIFGYQGLYLMK